MWKTACFLSTIVFQWCDMLRHMYQILISPLAPRKFEWNLMWVIFMLILVTDGLGISCEIAARWMSRDLSDDKAPNNKPLPEPMLIQIYLTKWRQ